MTSAVTDGSLVRRTAFCMARPPSFCSPAISTASDLPTVTLSRDFRVKP
jgi:hypothetical protein